MIMQASLVYKNVGKTLNLMTRYVDENRHAELLQVARTAYEDSRVLWTTLWKEYGNFQRSCISYERLKIDYTYHFEIHVIIHYFSL